MGFVHFKREKKAFLELSFFKNMVLNFVFFQKYRFLVLSFYKNTHFKLCPQLKSHRLLLSFWTCSSRNAIFLTDTQHISSFFIPHYNRSLKLHLREQYVWYILWVDLNIIYKLMNAFFMTKSEKLDSTSFNHSKLNIVKIPQGFL